MVIKKSSNKSFGIVFFIVFIIIGFWPLPDFNNYRLWPIIIAFIFLSLGLANSKLLTPLNILWFKFGILLSKIVSPIVMGFVFFIVVTPLALLAKIVGKDFLELDRKINKKKKSYWIEKEKYKHSMRDQF